MIRLTMVVICGLLVCSVASADEDAVGTKLAAAKVEYDKAAEKARGGLVADLKRRAEGIQKAGDLRSLEVVEAEIKALEERGELPKSVPTKGYDGELRRARARISDAYAAAVRDYTKAGQRAQAKATQQELDELKDGWESGVLPTGTWRLAYNVKVSAVTTIEVDGSATHVDTLGRKESGKLEPRGKAFVIRYQTFVEVWTPSADGKKVAIAHYQPRESYPDRGPKNTATAVKD